jgi:hypothetical protein
MNEFLERAKKLVDREYIFDDGDKIKVIQVTWRSEDQIFIHVIIQQGPGIPRKLRMNFGEFMDYYGHLFRDDVKMKDTIKHYIDDTGL